MWEWVTAWLERLEDALDVWADDDDDEDLDPVRAAELRRTIPAVTTDAFEQALGSRPHLAALRAAREAVELDAEWARLNGDTR